MGDKSAIEWTDATWNPVTGCTEVSPGCDHCYAKVFAERFRGVPGHGYEQGFDLRLWPERAALPLLWKKPRRIFVNSMSDLFHQDVPDEFIDLVFNTIRACPEHTFQVLTKRPGRFSAYFRRWDELGLTMPPNMWLGVSVESQEYVWRIEKLLAVPATVRFVSAEPLLGPLDLRPYLQRWGVRAFEELDLDALPYGALDWVIVGGESGRGARPMHPDWVRRIRDDCFDAGVPFFFKQWGEWLPGNARWDPDKHRRVYFQDGSTDGHKGRRDYWWDDDQGRPDDKLVSTAVGKHAAGRLLDRVTWDQFPAVPS